VVPLQNNIRCAGQAAQEGAARRSISGSDQDRIEAGTARHPLARHPPLVSPHERSAEWGRRPAKGNTRRLRLSSRATRAASHDSSRPMGSGPLPAFRRQRCGSAGRSDRRSRGRPGPPLRATARGRGRRHASGPAGAGPTGSPPARPPRPARATAPPRPSLRPAHPQPPRWCQQALLSRGFALSLPADDTGAGGLGLNVMGLAGSSGMQVPRLVI
jgi:hypothetical protein